MEAVKCNFRNKPGSNHDHMRPLEQKFMFELSPLATAAAFSIIPQQIGKLTSRACLNFGKCVAGSSFLFGFAPRVFKIVGWMAYVSDIQQYLFSDLPPFSILNSKMPSTREWKALGYNLFLPVRPLSPTPPPLPRLQRTETIRKTRWIVISHCESSTVYVVFGGHSSEFF